MFAKRECTLISLSIMNENIEAKPTAKQVLDAIVLIRNKDSQKEPQVKEGVSLEGIVRKLASRKEKLRGQ